MNQFFVFFCLLFFAVTHSQNPGKDTIQLNEVLIVKGVKKTKLKKIKIGTHDLKYSDNYLFFNESNVLYLTDSLPEGYVQQVALFFVETAIEPKIGFRDYKTFKIHKTEYEITLYAVNDDYSVGEKVNIDPIHLALEETNSDKIKKVELNLAQYNFKTKRFYIALKRTTDTACQKCYFHAPVLYRTGDKNHIITDYEKEVYKKHKKDCSSCYGLQMVVKTLTGDY